MTELAEFVIRCHEDPLYRLNTCYQIINSH